MTQDPIVEEVRRIRQEQASRHKFDLKAILSAARRRQQRSKRKVTALVSKKRLAT